jgi:hypothetical protein
MGNAHSSLPWRLQLLRLCWSRSVFTIPGTIMVDPKAPHLSWLETTSQVSSKILRQSYEAALEIFSSTRNPNAFL